VIPALRRLRQEDHEFKGTLGYIERPVSKKIEIRYPIMPIHALSFGCALAED
jgi:hypothetical protein